MDTPISRGEHEEFARRIADQERRQDKRLELLEGTVREIGDLTLSVHTLAKSMESMVKEQEAQGKRLVSLESKDGEMWRKVVGYVITTIIGIAVGFMFTQIGM